MGPIIIFDKSALESLRADEACWLDAHYLPNITPLFFVETLADLQKKVAKSRKLPEQIVGNLADKTPPNACANVYHGTLCLNELLGVPVKMERYPVVGGGQSVATEQQRGVFFSPAPEMMALARWQHRKFLEVEREFACVWRRALSGVNYEETYKRYRCKLGSLEEAKKEADRLLNRDGYRYESLKLAVETIGVGERVWQAILTRWKILGGPSLLSFAPYTAHVLTVDLFVNLALGADLISRDRPSNKVDIAYLYYLPFCMIFVSNDNLHERTVKCFLGPDQMFLRGEDLKADLAKLDEHYSKLPDEVKMRGVMSFASNPPHEGFLTTDLWDQFMRPDWREPDEPPADTQRDARLVEYVNQISDAARRKGGVRHNAGDSDDFMVIEKLIPVHMGKWRLIPPEAEKQNSR